MGSDYQRRSPTSGHSLINVLYEKVILKDSVVGQDSSPNRMVKVGLGRCVPHWSTFYFSLLVKAEEKQVDFIHFNNKINSLICGSCVQARFCSPPSPPPSPHFHSNPRLMDPALNRFTTVFNTLRRGNVRLIRSAVLVDLMG